MWLFKRDGEYCKGSARSIPGFDVTEAMMSCGHLFHKFGGHAAAGGFSFKIEFEDQIREALTEYAKKQYEANSLRYGIQRSTMTVSYPLILYPLILRRL